MKVEQAPVRPELKRDPFFKRVGTDIADWFVTRAKRIKERFINYIKSKETRKLWKRRLIVVAVILLIAASFQVKEWITLYPYPEDSYLSVSSDRGSLSAYDGSSGFSRLNTFKVNVDGRLPDKIRIVTSVNGYTVMEDLEYDGGSTIKLTIDNRKNKMLDADKRVKETIEYIKLKREIVDDFRVFTLVAEDGSEYLVAKQSLK